MREGISKNLNIEKIDSKVSLGAEAFKAAKQVGLPESIVSEWYHYCSDFSHIVPKHIENVLKLEAQTPGIVLFLYMHFNIRHFGRYPVEMLLKQYNRVDDKKQNWMAVILAARDRSVSQPKSSDSCFTDEWLGTLGDLDSARKNGLCIPRFFEAGSLEDLVNMKNQIKMFGYKNPSAVLFSGHSDSQTGFGLGIKDGESIDLTKADLLNDNSEASQLFQSFGQTEYILDGCELGEKNGFGQVLANTTRSDVYAQAGESALKNLKIIKAEKGQPTFIPTYNGTAIKFFPAPENK